MTQWQKHWSNTVNDPRIQMLIGEMGARGYGIYWLVSERICGCEERAVNKYQLVRNMCSRRLNSRFIERVIDNYYLFETDGEGYVRHHPVQIGGMSAQKLLDLKNGKEAPPRTRVQHNAEHASDDTYYNVRADEKNREKYNHISCNAHEMEKQTSSTEVCSPEMEAVLSSHPAVREALGSFVSKPWCPFVLSLFDPKYRMWRQTTCLHSGYPLLLDRHWEEAVVGFIHHIIAYDKADEIRSEQNVHYYFASFVSRYNISGKKLLAQLKQKETSSRKTEVTPSFPGANEFEEERGGKRYADGKPIPNDAPPRPSATAVWDAGGHQWIEL